MYNELGYGFLENNYQEAMAISLRQSGRTVTKEAPLEVYFKNQVIGEYYADLVVEDSVLLELKVTKTLLDKHEAQLLNYLKATDIEVGLLLNFGPEPEIKRKVYDNERK